MIRSICLVLLVSLLGACTYNYYPMAQHHEAPVPAPVVDAPPVPVLGQTPVQVDLNALPVLSATTQEYVKAIPGGVFAPMWNRMGIGDDVDHPQIADIVVGVDNHGQFAAANGPRPQANLDWKPVKVIVYANNPDHTVRIENGKKVKVLEPLWVAMVRR